MNQVKGGRNASTVILLMMLSREQNCTAFAEPCVGLAMDRQTDSTLISATGRPATCRPTVGHSGNSAP